ncbi:PqiC family protein [Maritimibacter sp. UBA3975]|uniref:PqiC family protein n=1 Tax=Maritimibacter sp. UBA3975 TaxID=1946833 RepID=UPI000C08FD9F|nr:PqiC family protein [Maritimibacter sp. UBA3975]MAM61106.1 hypothetical protein [Maritimibacter sp.]|tara:strand:+ start:6450 stop:7013 length:564 start_codon:yes stop_codon:yes gene_type:complete
MFRIAAPLALILLAACGNDGPRYLIDTGPTRPDAVQRVSVATLEIMDVSLPAYAEDSEIMLENDNGALVAVDNALWADDPQRAVTQLLTDEIARTSTATTASEPWPLENPPQAAVHVRVSEMVARENGTLDLRGQYAISSYGYVIRERIERFDISVPLPDTSPAAIANASGLALRQLAADVVQTLSR